jgi:DNA topoisomerase-1
MVIKDGRFGAYVTDGEVNATLRRDDEIETITAERAAELLAEKRAKGPAPKKRPAARKAPAKKAAANEPANGSRTAKRTVAKRTVAKKTVAKKTLAK